MHRIILTLAMLLIAPAAPALDADEMFTDPAMEARARDLGRQLRCLKCRNQSIFDSNAGIAKDLRVAVRERITAGDTDADVLAYVHERFGDYVLLKPPVSAETYLLWLTPVGLILIAGVGFGAYLRGQGHAARAELSADDRAAAQELLKSEGER